MTLTSDERQRFLDSLRTDAAFRDEVRRELLTAELLTLPERFAAFVEEMHAFVEATNRRFDGLEQDVHRLQDDSGRLRGMVLEQKIQMNPGYYLRKQARRVRIVDLDDLLDDLGVTELGDEDYVTLGRTDVIARGVAKGTGVQLVFLVEATWRVHTGDVDHQVIRRQILLGRGVEAVAVIASTEEATEELREYATARGVVLEHAGMPYAA